jgi:hypothetical protein
MPRVSHTPGPWENDYHFIVAPDPRGLHRDIYIAEIADRDDEGRVASPRQQSANARLIAAAPDLLRAAETVVSRWEKGDLAEAVRYLDAAIATAKGRAQ